MIKRLIILLLVVGTLSALSVFALPQARADTASSSSSSREKQYRALLTPNDPIYPQWYTDKISAPEAWDITTGSSDVIVAVIDTGFGLNHEDMAGRWAENPGEGGAGCTLGCEIKRTNGLDDDGNGKIDDWRGWDFVQNDNNPSAGSVNPSGDAVHHGTVSAGLVGATGNNAKGVASLNWGARILPLQALNDDGVGSTSTIAAAIDYAVVRGAKVISLSLGSDEPDAFLRQRIGAAIDQGVIIVAAAGNSGCDCMAYPANYPEVVAVGATNSSDIRASFSSYGANLDVMAPGAGTIKVPFWSSTNQTTLYTSSVSGTSISTPIVAGLVGLIKTQSPSATVSDIIGFVRDGADKVPGMGGLNWTEQYGWGRINAYRAVRSYLYGLLGQEAYTDSAKTTAIDLSQLSPGQTAWLVLRARNTGTATWSNSGSNPVRLGTDNPRDRDSGFASGWLSPNRAATLQESSVAVGANGTFEFLIHAPALGGVHREHFTPVAEGYAWLNATGLNYYIEVNVGYNWEFAGQAAYADATKTTPVDLTNMSPGQTVYLVLAARNNGNATWYQSGSYPVRISTTNPRDRLSGFCHTTWLSCNRPTAAQQNDVVPGQTTTFEFYYTAPPLPGPHKEHFSLVAEQITWLNDPGVYFYTVIR